MEIESIQFENYKCFKSAKLNNFKSINIIIGKNNIGKSSLLDIIEMVNGQRNSENVKIEIIKRLSENDILTVFKKRTHTGGVPNVYTNGGDGSDYYYGMTFLNEPFIFETKSSNGNIITNNTEDITSFNSRYVNSTKYMWDMLATRIRYKQKTIKRILAERNVIPETESPNMNVDGNGNGITTVIANYLNKSNYDEGLVREKMLNTLNEIMGEDANFTEIVAQQVEKDNAIKWEIFLREKEKGRIALSESGSGLKTILMVLTYTILLPDIMKKKLNDYIFLFEELENNLHPSLQRRLLRYIEELAECGAEFFLTTHSNIVLDSFENDKTNIIHVLKNNGKIEALNASEKLLKNNIINDLGIKASDILQSNGIIWVEGPSDRIYINKWIELWSNGKYKEGKDYQCVFYGGRLLSNLTLEPEEENELVDLLTINRNAIIVIDSDKTEKSSKINNTKIRIKSEAEKNSILCWITKGREIENYIPSNLILKKENVEMENNEFGQYENLEDYLDKLQEGKGVTFTRNKINYAKKICDISTKDNLKDSFDLDEMITKVIKSIEKWNS